VLDERRELVVRPIEVNPVPTLSTPRTHKVIAYVPIGGPERLANARLIAEGPRMLELLTTALDLMSRDEYDSFFGQEIRDLLRDVAGEEE